MFKPFCFILLTAGAIPAAAAPVQPIEAIRERVADFLRQRLAEQPGTARIEVGRIDPRLRLPACGRPLEAFLPPGRRRLAGRVTVGVRCAGERPWKLFVGAAVDRFRRVVVLARPARRGEILSAAYLRLEERNTSELYATYFVDPSTLLGTQATRSLRAGTVLSANHVAAAKVVRRGQRVVLLAKGRGIEVRMQGKALMDGATGDLIRVRNARSTRIVEGTVVDPGVVEVPM